MLQHLEMDVNESRTPTSVSVGMGTRTTPISPSTRIRRARELHQQLQRKRTSVASIGSTNTSKQSFDDHSICTSPRRTIEYISEHGTNQAHLILSELQTLWKQEKKLGTSTTTASRLEKIGSDEKDTLILHMLERLTIVETQRNDVASLGEKIAAQLVQQQHSLRTRFKEQTTALEEELHQARFANPEIQQLEQTIESLRVANHENTRKLQFALLKLQQSRKRERELKQQIDGPLWDL